MSGKFSMDDYVPVNERVDAFYSKFPDGSIQSEIVELTDSRVTVKAYAYRTADDERPGIGHSSLDIPGSTPYTRGSEIENCETSAWGRAIAALGFEVKRGISSREEIANKQPEPRGARASSPRAAPAPDQYRREELAELMREKDLTLSAIEVYANLVGIPKGERATNDQMDALIDAVRGHGIEEAIEPAVARAADEAVAVPSPVESPAGDPPPAGPPPKPSTDAYRSLSAQDKANARAYWATHEEPEQETLAEALGAPLA